MPPCGGVPNSSASTKKPKRAFASSSDMPSSLKISRCSALVVDPDAAAADLAAVEHHVVGARADAARDRTRAAPASLSSGAVNGMVHELPALLVLQPVEHREVDDPEELEAVRVEQVLAASRCSGAAGRALRAVGSCAPAAISSRSAGAGAGDARAPGGSSSSPAALSAGALHGAVGAGAPRPARRRRVASLPRSGCRGPCANSCAPPGTTKPRTSPPASIASRNTREVRRGERRREVLQSPSRAQVRLVGSVASRSPRRTASAETAAAPRARPAPSAAPSAARACAKTRSSVANEISRSTCVNSGWRSARRSSSRKHFAIWK